MPSKNLYKLDYVSFSFQEFTSYVLLGALRPFFVYENALDFDLTRILTPRHKNPRDINSPFKNIHSGAGWTG